MFILYIYLAVCYTALLPELLVGTIIEKDFWRVPVWLSAPVTVPILLYIYRDGI